ncbi:MAG TPA: hypothetical protein VG711_07450 [Phycisphaerales bacterium]|nr:hypothetical protein [Phycisphaerales bacterium]
MVIKVAVFLVIGAVVNVLVAWGCAWKRSENNQSSRIGFPSSEDQWLRSIGIEPTDYDRMTIEEAEEVNNEPSDDENIFESDQEDNGELAIKHGAKEWTGDVGLNDRFLDSDGELIYWVARCFGFEVRVFSISTALQAFPGEFTVAQQFRAGWPIHSFYGQMTETLHEVDETGKSFEHSFEYRYRYVILPQGMVQPPIVGELWAVYDKPMLPTLPMWRGFAFNTIFYGLIMWILWNVPFATRRWIRRTKGLCAWCAYPVGTSEVCTECGKPVRAVRKIQERR